jgi:hypothetical protein
MRLAGKDTVGAVLVLSTFAAFLLHTAPTRHRDSHISPIADAGGSVTSSVDVPTVAFVDVNVVTMVRDEVIRRQVVLVRDGFVTRIGDVGVVEPPPGALVIEGGGSRYLMPGLTDAHVHLGDDPDRLLMLFVANGVTTVFNLQGDAEHVELRDRIRSGEVVGPTIYTAGPFVDARTVRSPTDALRTVRRQRARGYDFVKLHGDLTAESYDALNQAALEEGIAVVGHAPRNLPFSAVLGSGQAALTHAEELIYTRFMTLSTAELPQVAVDMERAGTWLIPGLANFRNVSAQWGAPEALRATLDSDAARFLPTSLRRAWASDREYADKDPAGRARLQDMLAFHTPLIRAMNAEGVSLLAGSDAALPGMIPGFSMHQELAELHGAGLSRFEALESATSNAGRFIREHVDKSANFGTIRVGARADLVLVDQDPRATLEVLRRPRGVMLRGRWFDRSGLDRLLTPVTAGR